ncbi:MAG: hypothetical protein MUP85_24665, partial [Candidatus Lokiarchaeota archaeon]|nr:hypothetical protein [Candidatus Lokiarchaeota archaeon]
TIAAGVWKVLPDGDIAPCVVRLSDFKTNEYQNLLGGWIYENVENNPMLGFRGASRYVSNDFQNAFILELKAIAKAREWGLINIIPMIPFCRTPEEAQKVGDIMKSQGIIRGENGLQIYCMAEIPSNIICADLFCEYFDGFSIGSNDLTMLTYGVDRDEAKLIPIAKRYSYHTNSEAMRRSISHLIKTAHGLGKKVGICGQAPSDDPEFLRFLVKEGIDSISLNFDTFAQGRINTWRTEIIEAKITAENKKLTYEFIDKCDKLIDKIRVPRGTLRNMLRKQRDENFPILEDVTAQFDDIFEKVNSMSRDFMIELNKEISTDFNTLFQIHHSKINDLEELLPKLISQIRDFGIF